MILFIFNLMLTNLKKLIQGKESRQIIQFLEDHPEVMEQTDEKGTSGFFQSNEYCTMAAEKRSRSGFAGE